MQAVACKDYILIIETTVPGSPTETEMVGKFDTLAAAQSIAGGRVITYNLYPERFNSYPDFASRVPNMVPYLGEPFRNANGKKYKFRIMPVKYHYVGI